MMQRLRNDDHRVRKLGMTFGEGSIPSAQMSCAGSTTTARCAQYACTTSGAAYAMEHLGAASIPARACE